MFIAVASGVLSATQRWGRVTTTSCRSESSNISLVVLDRVNPGRGKGGGPGPPSREQDKQLDANRGGDNSLMERQEGREKESGVTKRTHRARSTQILCMFITLCVNITDAVRCYVYVFHYLICSVSGE